MKHFKFLAIAASALLVSAALSFSACGDEDEPNPANFQVTPTSLEFDATGGTKSIAVTGDWDATPTTEAAWLTLNAMATKVTVTAEANTGNARNSTVKIGTATITVTQKKEESNAMKRLNANPISLTFAAESAPTQDVTVIAENVGTWSANSTDSWITVTEKTGAFTVSVSDNMVTAERIGSVFLIATEYTGVITITVKQEGMESSVEYITIDDLIGSWSVTSMFINNSGSYSADHTATITKINNNTVKINAFLGTATMFGEAVDCDSQTFTFNPSNNSLTIINPNGTEVTWDEDYFCFIAVMQHSTFADNVGIEFPVYSVVKREGVISIDFSDPKSEEGRIQCCVVAADKDTKEVLRGFGLFYDTEFTKGGTKAPQSSSNSSTINRYMPCMFSAF